MPLNPLWKWVIKLLLIVVDRLQRLSMNATSYTLASLKYRCVNATQYAEPTPILASLKL